MAKKKTEIKKRDNKDLTGFFGMEPAASAIQASGFDIHEEMETIIRWSRDADPKVSLPALKHLRTVLKEIAVANGMFGTVQQTRKADNGEQSVQQTISTHTLLSNLRKENEQQATEFFQATGNHETFLPLEEQHPSKEPEKFFSQDSQDKGSRGPGPGAGPGGADEGGLRDPEDV